MTTRRGSLRPRSKLTKTGRKRPEYSAAALKKKKAMATKMNKTNVANAKKKFYNTKKDQAKWNKLAKDWMSKPRKSKKVKSKAGKMVNQNVYFQFVAYIESKSGKSKAAKSGSRFLGQFLWKKFAKKGKAVSGHQQRQKSRAARVKVPQAKRHKALTKAEILKKAKTYKRSKVLGKFGKLRGKVGLKNAQKIKDAAKKL